MVGGKDFPDKLIFKNHRGDSKAAGYSFKTPTGAAGPVHIQQTPTTARNARVGGYPLTRLPRRGKKFLDKLRIKNTIQGLQGRTKHIQALPL